MAVSFTGGNDFIIPTEDGQTYLGGAGDDSYILSPYTLSAGATITITDTEGDNTIQLVDGLEIASSKVYSNALQLTLSNGTNVQILGSSGFNFEVGGNAVAGVTGTLEDFDTFVSNTLGTSVPDSGFSEGGAVVIGETGSNIIDMAAGNDYYGEEGVVDVFQYELDSSSGRVVGKDGEVDITGFTAGEDRLEFVDVEAGTLTDANFTTFPGVSLAENPFQDQTTIAFDPDEGVASFITLAGIQDAALDTIDYSVV